MENTLLKTIRIPSSACDMTGKLGIRNLFDCFMDLAGEHADVLGVGYIDMLRRESFWVAVRTRVRIRRMPEMGCSVTAETWPGKPGRAKSERYYRLLDGDEILAVGRTEWAAQDIGTGAIRRTDSIGWPDIETRSDRVCGEPFTRFLPLASGETFSYTVSSMDIDTGRHMNNVAYIRMLLATLSTEELAPGFSEAEISYRRACFEGECLTVRRVCSDGAWSFQVERPDGEIAVQASFLKA